MIKEGQIYKITKKGLKSTGFRFVISKYDGCRIAAIFSDGSVLEFNEENFMVDKNSLELLNTYTSWEEAISSPEFKGLPKPFEFSCTLDIESKKSLEQILTPKDGTLIPCEIKVNYIAGSPQDKLIKDFMQNFWDSEDFSWEKLVEYCKNKPDFISIENGFRITICEHTTLWAYNFGTIDIEGLDIIKNTTPFQMLQIIKLLCEVQND